MFIYIALAVSTVLSTVILVFGGLFGTYIDIYMPLGAGLIFNMLRYLSFIITAVLLFVVFAKLLNRRIRSFIICAIVSIAILLPVMGFPFSSLNARLNYMMNKDALDEFVESLDTDDLPQVDVITYYIGDIRLSYTGTVEIETVGEVTKIMFFVTPDTHRVLIYSSDGSAVSNYDFSSELPLGYCYDFKNIKKLDDKWYMAEKW